MADTASTPAGGENLEQQLEEMLDIETFDPPEEFREHALLNDPAVYEEAEKDWKGWWVKQAKELHWFKEPTEDLDDSNPPFYKWFADGKINASYNCLDRHVEAGNGDRVAYHWHGEEGEERDGHLRRPASRRPAVRQRAEGPRDREGRRRRDLSADDPRGRRRDAGLRADRRAVHNVVFGGFSPDSVKERMEFSEAKALITVDGARRKGKTAPIKQQVDAVMGDLDTLEHIVVVKSHRRRVRDDRRAATSGTTRSARPPIPSARPRSSTPSTRCSCSTPAGSTAKPKGVLHTTGGYLTGVSATHRYVFDLKPERGRVLVRGRCRLGHRPLLHRLRTAVPTAPPSVMWEGAPDYPHKGIWWELVEQLQGDDPLHARRRRSAPA